MVMTTTNLKHPSPKHQAKYADENGYYAHGLATGGACYAADDQSHYSKRDTDPVEPAQQWYKTDHHQYQ